MFFEAINRIVNNQGFYIISKTTIKDIDKGFSIVHNGKHIHAPSFKKEFSELLSLHGLKLEKHNFNYYKIVKNYGNK